MLSKKSTSIWLSDTDKALLKQIATTMGVSQSDVLTLLIREKAKQEGITTEQALKSLGQKGQ